MSIIKALLGALGVTAVSCILLTITRGVPTTEQLVGNGITMFVFAFVVLKFFSGENARKSNNKGT